MANRHDHGGGAVETTLNANIGSGDTSLVLVASTGWPSGGANGTFGITIGVIDPVSRQFVSNIEKIQGGSRTGTTVSSLTRGADGTTALSHAAGETIRHTFPAYEAHQASEHAGNTTLDEHTQYHNAARHAAVVHTSAMLGTDSVGTDEIVANAVGASELADNAVDTAAIVNLAVTTGKINDLAVTAAKIAADTITAAQIAADAIGTSELAPDAVTATELAANAVGATELATGAVAATADIVDGIITFAKFAAGAATDWTSSITFDNVTLGTGGEKYAHYLKLGPIVVLFAGFRLGTGGDVTGKLGWNLPFVPVKLSAASIANRGGLVVGRIIDPGGGISGAGTGAILDSDNKATDILTASTAITDVWGNTPTAPLWNSGNGTIVQTWTFFVTAS